LLCIILLAVALLLPCSEAATGSDEAFGRRLLFRRSELLGRPTLSFPLYQAFDVGLRTSCGLPDGCFGLWDSLLLSFYTGWSLQALASLISLPEEPAGAAIRAPSALDVPADCQTFHFLVNSAYHSVFTFLVRVERIYSDSWLSSSLAARSSGRAAADRQRLYCCTVLQIYS
jgi:hypothetical protein